MNRFESTFRQYGAFCVVVLAGLTNSTFASFSPGHLVVIRIGDGAGPISDKAQAVFLDEYDAATGAFLASHTLPDSGDFALTLSGEGAHDGHLNLSTNGRYLLLVGYRADFGADNPVTQLPEDVNRVIGQVDSEWNVDTTTALTDAYDRTDITAVVSDDGKRFWTSGDGKYLDLDNGRVEDDFEVPTITGGLRYVPNVGATTSINVSQTQTIPADLDNDLWPDSIRSCRIVDGQLYIDTPAPESFGDRGAYATTDPLPTSGPQIMVPVITNAPPSTDTSGKFVPKSDVILLDMDESVPGIDTAYSTGGKADYQKWALVAGAWVRKDNKTLSNSSEEINAMSAVVSGGTVTLYAATDQGVYRLDDTAGYNAAMSQTFSTHLFEPGANSAFRGVALITQVCSADGDEDLSGRIDLVDFAALQRCFSGEDVFDGSPSCTRLDSDCNGLIDFVDHAAFEAVLQGP